MEIKDKTKFVEIETLLETDAELQELSDELTNLASDVVEEFNKNTGSSDNSNTIIQIHENSPILDENNA